MTVENYSSESIESIVIESVDSIPQGVVGYTLTTPNGNAMYVSVDFIEHLYRKMKQELVSQ